MSQYIQEELLERFVRFPGGLSPEEKREVALLLEQSQAAREMAQFFRDFYAELDLTVNRPSLSKQFVDSLFLKAPVIRLLPRSARSQGGRTVLAASTRIQPRQFETCATLASADDDIVARFVRNRNTGACQVYLISREEVHRAHCLIQIPALGLRLLTGKTGRASFEPPPGPLTEKLGSAILHQPLAHIELSAEAGSPVTVALSGRCIMHITREGQTIDISVVVDGPNYPSKADFPSLAVLGDESKTSIPLAKGCGRTCIAPIGNRISVRFYA